MDCPNKQNCVVLRNHVDAARRLFMDKMNPEFTDARMSLEDINLTYGTNFHKGFFCVVIFVADHLYNQYKVLELFPNLVLPKPNLPFFRQAYKVVQSLAA
jgi:hypothetical protein